MVTAAAIAVISAWLYMLKNDNSVLEGEPGSEGTRDVVLMVKMMSVG